jgi:hypothetical protein
MMQMTNAARTTDLISHCTGVPSVMDIPARETTAAPCRYMATMTLHAASSVAARCIGKYGLIIVGTVTGGSTGCNGLQ